VNRKPLEAVFFFFAPQGLGVRGCHPRPGESYTGSNRSILRGSVVHRQRTVEVLRLVSAGHALDFFGDIVAIIVASTRRAWSSIQRPELYALCHIKVLILG
jgi:hypothetical protein